MRTNSRGTCLACSPLLTKALMVNSSTTYVYKVWVQTSEQTYRFRTCFRQHTFIKFEYRLISRTSYCPRLISLLVVGGEKTSLGGEYVGGEIVPWWRVRWWRVCLVARWLDTVRTLIALDIFLSHFIDNQPSDPCGSWCQGKRQRRKNSSSFCCRVCIDKSFTDFIRN